MVNTQEIEQRDKIIELLEKISRQLEAAGYVVK
jgi:hypothetical protein